MKFLIWFLPIPWVAFTTAFAFFFVEREMVLPMVLLQTLFFALSYISCTTGRWRRYPKAPALYWECALLINCLFFPRIPILLLPVINLVWVAISLRGGWQVVAKDLENLRRKLQEQEP